MTLGHQLRLPVAPPGTPLRSGRARRPRGPAVSDGPGGAAAPNQTCMLHGMTEWGTWSDVGQFVVAGFALSLGIRAEMRASSNAVRWVAESPRLEHGSLVWIVRNVGDKRAEFVEVDANSHRSHVHDGISGRVRVDPNGSFTCRLKPIQDHVSPPREVRVSWARRGWLGPNGPMREYSALVALPPPGESAVPVSDCE